MLTKEDLNNKYSKNCDDTTNQKYKWYSFFNQFVINKEVILKDRFWNFEEKQAIAKFFDNKNVYGLAIYSRVFMHEHLDVIVILNRRAFYGKNEKEKN